MYSQTSVHVWREIPRITGVAGTVRGLHNLATASSIVIPWSYALQHPKLFLNFHILVHFSCTLTLISYNSDTHFLGSILSNVTFSEIKLAISFGLPLSICHIQ